MKRITALSLSALVIGILACGGSDDATSTDGEDDDAMSVEVELPTVPITEPWKSMGLPTSSGQVVVSDATVLLVAHDDGSVSGLTSEYTAAISADGWSKLEDYSTPDFTAIVYEKGGQQVGFACGVEQEITFGYMEDLSKVGNNSTVRGAKSGRRGIKRAEKYGRGTAKKGNRSAKRVNKGSGSSSSSTKSGGSKKGGNKKKNH